MRQYRTGLIAIVLVFGVLVPAAPVSGATDAADCSYPLSVTDATGSELSIDSEPERVVTLAPSAAQTMWEIGARKKVVGISKYASYLEGAEERTNISGGGMTYVVVEKVVAQQPDLVLAPNIISDKTVDKLRESGLTVYKFREAKSVEDIISKTELTGQLVGECNGASETTAWMEDRLDTVSEASDDVERPSALYVFFGYTAGKGTFIDEIITTAGATNVAAQANITGYAKISDETVVEYDPDWLVLNSDGPSIPMTDAFNATTAVERDQSVVLNADYISQPAPRIVIPITKLAKTFHPDAYAAANTTESPSETSSPTTTDGADDGAGANEGTTEPAPASTVQSTTSEGQAGFSALFALVAVIAGGLLVRD